jgi:5-methylcytosine-specific restriction endonuclease McrA
MIRKRKPKTPHPLYLTPAWRTLRKRILARDGYCCRVCHAWVGGPGLARIDHIERITDNPVRALDPSNLRTLCTRCDAQGHRERGTSPSKERIERFNYGHDDLGKPRDPNHHWAR